MKLLISAAAGAALFLLSTAAMADVSGLYGNTVVATFPDGKVIKVQLKADGAFSETLPDGSAASGTYTDDANGVCFTQTAPPPPADAKPTCAPDLAGKKAGDAWDAPGPQSGTTLKISVVAGQ
jgi:hypothetical protein